MFFRTVWLKRGLLGDDPMRALRRCDSAARRSIPSIVIEPHVGRTPGDQVDQGGFPGPARADDGHDLALDDLRGDVRGADSSLPVPEDSRPGTRSRSGTAGQDGGVLHVLDVQLGAVQVNTRLPAAVAS